MLSNKNREIEEYQRKVQQMIGASEQEKKTTELVTKY